MPTSQSRLRHQVLLSGGVELQALTLRDCVRTMLEIASKISPLEEKALTALDQRMQVINELLRKDGADQGNTSGLSELQAESLMLEAILEATAQNETSRISLERVLEFLDLAKFETIYAAGFCVSRDLNEWPIRFVKAQQYLSFALPSYQLSVLHRTNEKIQAADPDGPWADQKQREQDALAIKIHARRAVRIRTALMQIDAVGPRILGEGQTNQPRQAS